VLRRYFAWARQRKLILIDPARPLRPGAQPGFTGTVLDTGTQRALLRRWTSPATHPHERLAGLCTNTPDDGIPGIPGSHHPQFIDAAHREHAVVETGGVRTAKAMGLLNLPSKSWQVNCGWTIGHEVKKQEPAQSVTRPQGA